MSDKDNREQYISDTISWMYDMELVENRHLQDDLYINLYKVSRRIKDLELFIHKDKHTILVFVKFDFIGNMFKSIRKKAILSIIENIQFRLPKFNVRVTTSKKVLARTYAMIDLINKQPETGGDHEKTNTNKSNSDVQSESKSED